MGRKLVTATTGSLGLEVMKALYSKGYSIRAMVNDYVPTRDIMGKKYGGTTFKAYLNKLELDKLP